MLSEETSLKEILKKEVIFFISVFVSGKMEGTMNLISNTRLDNAIIQDKFQVRVFCQ